MTVEITSRIEGVLERFLSVFKSRQLKSNLTERLLTVGLLSKNTKKAAVLNYWHSIELFSPPVVPQVHLLDDQETIFDMVEKEPVPWDSRHPLQKYVLPDGKVWRYQFFCGLYPIDYIRETLEEVFGKDPEISDSYSESECCILTFCVSKSGQFVDDSFELSTCAWAVGRTLDPGPKSPVWLVGFKEYAEEIKKAFRNNLIFSNEPLTYLLIEQEIRRVVKELGIERLCEKIKIRIKAQIVVDKEEDPEEEISEEKSKKGSQSLLNSFFLEDLEKIRKEVLNDNYGQGLHRFLLGSNELDISTQVDVRKFSDFISQTLLPQNFPIGCWPAKGHYPLVMSQQLAINLIESELSKNPGLFAVNGPPGTGKTTLLRDLIANVIVKRAACLSDLTSPQDAFIKGKAQVKTPSFNYNISCWREEFKGFEIVIASSTNGAVENISLEIPGIEAIDPTWLNEIDYFKRFGKYLLGKPAWALMATRLGNKANCQKFLKDFWYSDKDKEGKIIRQGFCDFLKEMECPDWTESVARFKEALLEEEIIRKNLCSLHEKIKLLHLLTQEILNLNERKCVLSEKKEEISTKIGNIEKMLEREKERVKLMEEKRLTHRRFFPSLTEIILSRGKSYKDWQTKDANYKIQLEESENSLYEVTNSIPALQNEGLTVDRELQSHQTIIESKQGEITDLKNQLSEARQKYGDNILATFKTEHESELSSPWAVPIWNKARTRVFLEALRLHKAFIAANASIIRQNLNYFMAETLSGSTQSEAVHAAAWTTLFFVIPVVSTTFASVGRLFSQHGKQTLGWLLIDEAGQAAPQSAAGAIWRAKRTVIIGDPMQLQPVIPIPFTAQHALRDYYNVEDTWVPGTTSAQILADRVSRFGTHLTLEEQVSWVSLPLRVHRRCDRLMFEIVNRISYGGMMVFGTHSPQISLPQSRWIDVASYGGEGHWICAEGEAVDQFLKQLISKDFEGSIFLISAFKAVVRNLWKFTQIYKNVRVGTIHTMQGKEADIVILVLGGDPNKPGAKRWVSSKPNLLNVAVSRAKRRFYIVGNQNAWSKFPYFKDAYQLMNAQEGKS